MSIFGAKLTGKYAVDDWLKANYLVNSHQAIPHYG